ncbi:proton-dependent oligopeptide transporter, POT family [Lutibacter agarilyticus]|uniref:Proton-dependent oligopeptide transporter, POT family n=1 Tax=Lutibacter agarilyticus TaxID=1109740 RepID=A0A238XRT4_9FLAO|nr:peptide MFS transporter [Lutibacter agarilyticus]SNR61221.1 proton-dependent oligopeptide transporter, POT family [Lutibacter agarilyticus]
MAEKTLWGHPKGLYVLFFTEMWERFSYYGMRAILILYLTAKTSEINPGLGWDKVSALELYGWYTMMVYVMSVPGGLLADRLLGQKKTVMLGGFLLCIGHIVLAFDAVWAFYTGIVLIVLGVGALKPNISTMVGGLYKQGDIKRDSAFTIFYIGINIGAFIAPLLVGYVGEVINWHYGFGLAGIGMLLGQLVYIWGQKYLKDVGNFVPVERIKGSSEKVKLTAIEKDRMVVLILSFIIVIVFWGAYEQAGGLMNLYARDKIDRVMFGFTVPTSFLQALHAFYVIIIGVPIAYFWTQWRNKGKEDSSLFKMGVGTVITGFGFLLLAAAAIETSTSLDGKASIYWMLGAYFLHVVGELSISPVALSFITKLAPVKYASFMMGAYFMVSGLGNKVAGWIGEAAQDAGEYTIFMSVFAFCVAFGLLLIIFVKKLKKLTHGADTVQALPIVEAE